MLLLGSQHCNSIGSAKHSIITIKLIYQKTEQFFRGIHHFEKGGKMQYMVALGIIAKVDKNLQK